MCENFVTYKSRPIVRCGKTIYYGSAAKEYVVMMNVIAENQEGALSTATAIKCYLMKTDKSLKPLDAITQSAERPTLYDALELAAAWLNRVERAG